MLNIRGVGGGGALIFNEGFFCVAGFGGAYTWRGLFSEFYGIYLFSFLSRR